MLTPQENITQTLDSFAEQSIQIITEALAEKDQIIKDLQQKIAFLEDVGQKEMIEWYCKKAHALSRKYKACLFCQSDQDFMPELLECKACYQKNKDFWKGISLNKEVNHA